jgi:thiamine-phosphate pyrophosphorylase
MKGLYLVTDRALSAPRSPQEVVSEAVKGGVNAVQLREKSLGTPEFVQAARALGALLKPLGVPLIINDRVDVALAAQADGVHLGQSDMPYPEARRLLGPAAVIGLSVESLAQLQQAQQWDLSYIALSPIFITPTKPEAQSAWGVEGLQQARRISRHAIAAIGGINIDNAAQVLQAGADMIAVVSAICTAPSPREAAAALRRVIDACRS